MNGVNRPTALEVIPGVRTASVDLADPQRALGQRRREHDVEMRERRDDRAGERFELGLRAHQGDRVGLAGVLVQRPT